MLHAARTSKRTVGLALLGALVACTAATGDARAAASFSVTVNGAPGSATAPQPVRVGIDAALPAASGATQPALRTLSVALPGGFTTTLDTIVSCSRPAFETSGSAACPAGSRLGAGSASFVYASGGLRIPASTDELVLFHGERTASATGPGKQSALYLYLRITKPIALSFVVPGTVVDRPAPAGPLVTFDLGAVAQPGGGASVSVTRAAFEIARGLAAGACAAGRWTFKARLQYVGGALEERTADALCSGAPDTTRPSLRASARNGTPALGARFPIRLSEAAGVRVTLERRAGRRWVAVRRVTLPATAGESVLRIRRANGRALSRGRYRARLRAVDAAGLASPTRSVTFRLR